MSRVNTMAVWFSVLAYVATAAGWWWASQLWVTLAVNTVAVACLGFLSVTLAPPALRALREGAGTGAGRLLIGIWGVNICIFVLRLYAVLYTSLGRPDYLTSSPVSVLIVMGIVISSAYTSAAPVSDDFELPKVERRVRAFGLLFGGFCAGGLVVLAALGGAQLLAQAFS